MKRIALIFLVPFNVYAGTPQIIFGSTNGGINTASTSCAQIHGLSGGGFATAVDRGTGILSAPGTFSNFRACIDVPPGAGKSFAFTMQLGTRNSDSPITCTISDTNKCCSDVTHSSSTVAGDLIRVKAVPSGTPTANTSVGMSVIFTPTNENNFVVTGIQTGSSASTTYAVLVGATAARTTTTDTAVPMSPTGTFDSLYASVNTAPGVGNSWIFTFQTNGSASSITCTISGTSNTCNDVTHSSSTIRGDTVNVKIVPSGTPASTTLSVGMRFIPTNRGEFPILGNVFNALNTASNNYVGVPGGNMSGTAEPTQVSTTTSPSPGFIMKNGTYSVSTAPGGAASYTFAMRKNQATPANGPTVVFSGATTTARDDKYMVFTDTDNLTCQWAPSGTPTAGMFHAGFTGYFTQPQITPTFP